MRQVDVFFFIGSLYSYFAVMRAGSMAEAAGVQLRWRPFNLRAIMIEQNNIPRNNPVKMRYTWRDVERRARRCGFDFKPAPPYPVDPDGLANRVGMVAAMEGWCLPYAQATYRAWFGEHRAPGEPEHLRATLASVGKDPDAVLARAGTREVHERFDAETAAARQLGVFGAPTFVVGDEIFWGSDRLEDALEWASAGRPDRPGT